MGCDVVHWPFQVDALKAAKTQAEDNFTRRGAELVNLQTRWSAEK